MAKGGGRVITAPLVAGALVFFAVTSILFTGAAVETNPRVCFWLDVAGLASLGLCAWSIVAAVLLNTAS